MHDLGEVFSSPLAVVLGPSDVFEPDIVYISRARAAMIDDRGVMRGPPDVCVEVASESTRRRDRTVKFARYAYFRIPESDVEEPGPSVARALRTPVRMGPRQVEVMQALSNPDHPAARFLQAYN